MTVRIYHLDPYQKKCITEITESIKKEGLYHITLEDNIFYPGGGGQPRDFGEINEIKVEDIVQNKEKTWYILKDEPQVKDVECKIYWQRRLDLMQQHTGQHLLSAVFYNFLNGETNSFHLGEDYVSIDINIKSISNENIEFVEDKVNEYIVNNLKIKSYYIEKGELDNLPVRKHPKVNTNIRIVEIDGIDISPCGGTHLKSTGELGILKIIKTEKYKGSTRVYFKCGKRALIDYRNKLDVVKYCIETYSVKEEQLVDRIKRESEEKHLLNKELNDVKSQLNMYKAKKYIESANEKIIKILDNEITFNDIISLANSVMNKGNYVIIASSLLEKKALLCHSGEFDINCGKLFKENLSKFEGKGGGSPKKAQVMFTNNENLINFINHIEIIIKERYSN